MTERASRHRYIALIDQLMREIAWHAQKQAMHTLVRPEINITLPQMITLFAIQERGTCRMSLLADVTQQSAGTLTGIVDRLIDEKLVERTRNSEDRRVIEVMLTAEGKKRLTHLTDARHDATRRLLEQFSDDELTQVGAMFQRLLGGLQGGATPSGAP